MDPNYLVMRVHLQEKEDWGIRTNYNIHLSCSELVR